jgi:hypothetical protein
MKIPGLLEINTDLTHNDIKECKILNLTFSEPQAPRIISELGLIREIRYFKSLFKSVLTQLNIEENENVAIVSPSVSELIFNLSIICAIQNQNIEYVNYFPFDRAYEHHHLLAYEPRAFQKEIEKLLIIEKDFHSLLGV